MTLSVGVFVRIFLLGAIAVPALLANSAVDRCLRAAEVLDKVMGTPEKAIPQELMSRSQCIAIIPGAKKVGFVIGARYGKGLMSCRTKDNFGWTAPSAVKLEGGSFGLQIGGSSTDLVLLILNKRGAEKLMQSKFTLGGDAAVAAGAIGAGADRRAATGRDPVVLAVAGRLRRHFYGRRDAASGTQGQREDLRPASRA